jgi:uncharacterized protein (TIGR00251 family)
VTARIRVRVHPGARRARIAGWRADGALAVDVTAAPEGGKANEAVVRLLSEALGVGRAAVRVASGGASRNKWIEVDGVAEADIARRIAQAIPVEGSERGE